MCPEGKCLAGWASMPSYTMPRMPSAFTPRWNTGTNFDLAFASVGPYSCLPGRRVLEKFSRTQHRPLLITSLRFALLVPNLYIQQ